MMLNLNAISLPYLRMDELKYRNLSTYLQIKNFFFMIDLLDFNVK